VHAPPGQQGVTADCTQGYLMRPTLRIVEDANVGAIAGVIDGTLVTEECLPKVYVFSGSDVTPDDIEESAAESDVDPLAVINVAVQNGATSYPYRAAFLPPGSYTVALTCDDDDPTADDALTFVSPQVVAVQNNLIGAADFAPAAP